MTIQRQVNGEQLSFRLTDSELYAAFLEQEHIFDRCDIEDLITDLGDAETKEDYGVTQEQFKKLIDDMAFEKRRNMDEYDMSWYCARNKAVKTVLEKYMKEIDHG